MPMLARFITEDEGTNAIEYALLCSLILLAIIGAVTLFASRTTLLWSTIAAHI